MRFKLVLKAIRHRQPFFVFERSVTVPEDIRFRSKKEVYLQSIDSFGCVHNSSPNGGYQYWHGGKEMCQFFYVFEITSALIFQGVTNVMYHHIDWVLRHINQPLHQPVIQQFAKSEAPLFVNSVEEAKGNNQLHSVLAFVCLVRCCIHIVFVDRITSVFLHLLLWLVPQFFILTRLLFVDDIG
ncbi:hypothetical protein DSL64_20425 [Dyadobacter luteus]|uniref:Uncharacterized protein n=1 Tax=Dyadobacter luteus TaxID=2259619 RepID=A0A3D8Y6V7_9BACT|nr:hypothetical protein DSL64_20425 [Dyadobacter luteus]